jgi:hypothetical protein
VVTPGLVELEGVISQVWLGSKMIVRWFVISLLLLHD